MRFDVQGMHCGHCVRAITRAVQARDPAAQVEVDLAAGTIAVDAALTPAQVIDLLAAEGYAATAATPT